jgi:nitrogen fixation-related uncharacterized protein
VSTFTSAAQMPIALVVIAVMAGCVLGGSLVWLATAKPVDDPDAVSDQWLKDNSYDRSGR